MHWSDICSWYIHGPTTLQYVNKHLFPPQMSTSFPISEVNSSTLSPTYFYNFSHQFPQIIFLHNIYCVIILASTFLVSAVVLE